MALNKDKKRALDVLKASMKKSWGEDMFITEFDLKLPSISTGSILLDNELGVGGFPEGRIIEIYGDESSGKTTLSTIVCAEAQKKYPDQMIGFIDVEHAFNPYYAGLLGLNMDDVLFSQPNGAESALDAVIKLTESGVCSVIVLDSVGGLQTRKQLEGEVGDASVGELARLMSQNLPKVVKAAKRTGTVVIFINQCRSKITMYGDPNTTMGGRALPYAASVRIETKRKEILKDKDNPIGQAVQFTLKKNKVGRPFGLVLTNLYFGKGFDAVSELVEVAIKNGAIEQAGAWFYRHKGTDNELRWQGRASVLAYVQENPSIVTELKEELFGPQIKFDEFQEELEDHDDGALEEEDVQEKD